MRRFHHLPAPALRPFIERLWGWESGPDEVVALPTLLPGTGAELYFHYRQPFRTLTPTGQRESCPRAHLLCLRSQPLALAAGSGIGFVAVRFRAGMLHRFTDMPAGELIDRPLAADALWGPAGQAALQRVADADTAEERRRVIEDFLLRALRQRAADELAERAVTLLYRDSAALRIDDLASRLSLGRRQLERRVLALAGKTPSELRRLARLQKTVRTLLLDPTARPLDVALANGYYDQSHFTRDCRALARDTPARLLHAARARTHFYNTPRQPNGKMTTP